MPSIKEVETMSVLTLYRLLIKNMQFYPSKNRFQLLIAVKEEYILLIILIDFMKIKDLQTMI